MSASHQSVASAFDAMEQDVNGVSRSNLSPRAAAHRDRPRACSETVSAMAFNSTSAQPLDRSEMRAGRKIAGYRRNHDEQRTQARTGICILQS